MKPRRRNLAALAAGVSFLIVGSAEAHHSFSAQFDIGQKVQVRGVVKKVEWSNPHVYLYVDVRDGEGRVVNWILETAGPNTLSRRGWSERSLQAGEDITVIGYRARGNPHIAAARVVVRADGRRVFAGSHADGGPQR